MPGEPDTRAEHLDKWNDAEAASLSSDAKIALLKQRVAHAPLWIVANGISMGTSVQTGTRVRIVAHSRTRRGRIYAFVAASGTLTVHRLRGVSAGRAWLRGDGNAHDDQPVSSESIIGRVDRIEGVGAAAFTTQDIIGRVRLDIDSVRRRVRRR